MFSLSIWDIFLQPIRVWGASEYNEYYFAVFILSSSCTWHILDYLVSSARNSYDLLGTEKGLLFYCIKGLQLPYYLSLII